MGKSLQDFKETQYDLVSYWGEGCFYFIFKYLSHLFSRVSFQSEPAVGEAGGQRQVVGTCWGWEPGRRIRRSASLPTSCAVTLEQVPDPPLPRGSHLQNKMPPHLLRRWRGCQEVMPVQCWELCCEYSKLFLRQLSHPQHDPGLFE